MRRLILAALAVAAFATLPAVASAQDVQARRAERRAEMRQQRAERRAEMLQRLMERRPELKARVERRMAQGKRVDPLARKLLMERHLKRRQPELFKRLDLNQDGRLSLEELRQRRRIRRA